MTTGKNTRERCESAKTNFTNDDVMKYVIGALQWKLPRAPIPVVGLRLGGPEARLKRGPIWWRHHTQPTVTSTFDQVWGTATEGYVPETTAWLTSQKEKMQKGYSWQRRNQLFVSGGGQFSWNFIRWSHRAYSTVMQIFRKRSQKKFSS